MQMRTLYITITITLSHFNALIFFLVQNPEDVRNIIKKQSRTFPLRVMFTKSYVMV